MATDPNISALLYEMNHRAEAEPALPPLPLRRVLGMRIGSETYGIDIEHISEIVKLPPVTFVPGAPAHILGVTSLRGQIVPVINTRLILGLAPAGPDQLGPAGGGQVDKPRIVVIHQGELIAGLLVDAVSEVYDLRAPVEALIGVPPRRFRIKEGYIRLGDSTLILLQIPALFSLLTES